ncbi:MAG: hypothetical protein AAB229_08155 [Candidatus Hydrogenedentota bacterium]
MEFFDNLAQSIINFIAGTWHFFRDIAGTLVNSTFGWYSGVPVDPTIAAIFLYGMIIFAGGAWLFFGKALKFNK